MTMESKAKQKQQMKSYKIEYITNSTRFYITNNCICSLSYTRYNFCNTYFRDCVLLHFGLSWLFWVFFTMTPRQICEKKLNLI